MSAPGIGWVLAFTIAAEIGEIERFPSPEKLAGYTGLCPRVNQSGDKDRRGPLTKHGPTYLRWALLEATMHALKHPAYAQRYQRNKRRLGKQRGAKVAQVDIARRLTHAIWHDALARNPEVAQGARRDDERAAGGPKPIREDLVAVVECRNVVAHHAYRTYLVARRNRGDRAIDEWVSWFDEQINKLGPASPRARESTGRPGSVRVRAHMRLFSQDKKVESLKRAPLFADLSRKELVQLARLSDDVEVPAGRVLCKEGDRGREFFVLVEGEIDVARKGRRVATLGAGDFVGEISLLEPTPRTATVTAKTPLRFFVLTPKDFKQMLEENPSVERKILRALARRVLELSKEDPTLA